MKTNITEHNIAELTLWFQNDEYLYKEWNRAVNFGNWARVKTLADSLFIYTDEQLDELREDFMNESKQTK